MCGLSLYATSQPAVCLSLPNTHSPHICTHTHTHCNKLLHVRKVCERVKESLCVWITNITTSLTPPWPLRPLPRRPAGSAGQGSTRGQQTDLPLPLCRPGEAVLWEGTRTEVVLTWNIELIRADPKTAQWKKFLCVVHQLLWWHLNYC